MEKLSLCSNPAVILRVALTHERLAGCSKWLFSKDAASCHFKGMAGMIPTARNVRTRPPTGRYFSPALPSDCFAIDFAGRVICPGRGPSDSPTSPEGVGRWFFTARIQCGALQFSLHLSKGVAKAALYCAHRTSTVSSCAFCEQGGHLAAPASSF